MLIKNNLKMPSSFFPFWTSPLVLILVFAVGCKNFPVVENKRGSPPSAGTLPEDDYEDTNVTPPSSSDGTKPSPTPLIPTPAPIVSANEPKIGVIIGPGFLRSFIAIGILQEFHRARIPIQQLVGFEWGSLPAALYSLNGQANEVEWQMLKLNESSVLKKSLIRNQVETQSIMEMQDFLKTTFNHQSFEQTKIGFECLSFDYKKRQYFWMKKGEIATALPYCLASPPFSKPHLNNVGSMDIKLAVDGLRQKGANYIVFIDLLGSKNNLLDDSFSAEARVLWAYQQAQLAKSKGLIHFVVDTSSAPYSLLDFDSRRDMIRKGQEIGQQAVKSLATKLRL